MNDFIKQVIEEKFASKAQQRYFYAKANEKGAPKKEKKKWKKWASEFSSDTNFEKIPEKVENKEKEIEEIVDEKGNIKRSDIPKSIKKSLVGAKKRTDKVVKSAAGSMGTYGIQGTGVSIRYWTEGQDVSEIAMDDTLGYENTMGDDKTYEEAYHYFTKELGLPEDEANERLAAMGYIKGEKELVRLVENPKKFMQDYIESVLVKKTESSDVIEKEENQTVNPLILKQIDSLKRSLIKNNIPVDSIIKKLKGE
ncbi:MAG: hypothetical protein RLZ10_2297 [Bacteroidota bacterium]|jgi:hypothetical protein